MHFRVSTRRKGDVVYRYGQLVESYRRADGMPAHRVVASLGRLTEQEAENLKLAFKAGREGRSVVLAASAADALVGKKCQANYRYLSAAVYLELWRRWQLGSMIDALVPESNAEVPVSDVVASLVLQRSLAPDTKSAAVDWFAETALPELLAIQPGRFNNTRIHRALELLEIIERPLQQQLAKRITAAGGPLRVLFLDCTNTWFVGEGPDLARKGLTKEGAFKRQIGLALLCDHDGLPLRWVTVDGRHDERRTMGRLIRDVAEEPWVHQVPFVMDRAMGSASSVAGLIDAGVRFVTAVPSNEFSAYSSQIPLGRFDDVVDDTSEPLDSDHHLEQLGRKALDLGFEAAEDGQYLLDLGQISRKDPVPERGMSRARAALLLALRAISAVDEHDTDLAELAQRWGVSVRNLQRWRELQGLSSEVRRRVLAGDADRLKSDVLLTLARLPTAAQAPALDEAIAAAGVGAPMRPTRMQSMLLSSERLTVRAIVSFRPDLFARQRAAAEEGLASLMATVDDINERLRSPRSRRDPSAILGEAASTARKLGLTSVVAFEVETTSAGHQLHATVDQAEWRKRRTSDGIDLIIAHADQIGTAHQLVGMYFAKDKVEKCFRTIKSVCALRPVYHRTDHKVRAHVTLCVLGLLLERTLERELRSAGMSMTAPSATKLLRTCFLNRFEDVEAPLYTSTSPTPDQMALLRALDLEHLVDDDEIEARIQPR